MASSAPRPWPPMSWPQWSSSAGRVARNHLLSWPLPSSPPPFAFRCRRQLEALVPTVGGLTRHPSQGQDVVRPQYMVDTASSAARTVLCQSAHCYSPAKGGVHGLSTRRISHRDDDVRPRYMGDTASSGVVRSRKSCSQVQPCRAAATSSAPGTQATWIRPPRR